MECFICSKKDGDIISNQCPCKLFYCHEKCFEDFYDFIFCPFCFEGIEQPQFRIKFCYNDFFSLCMDKYKYKSILKKINDNNDKLPKKKLSKFEIIEFFDGGSFGDIGTVCISRSGELSNVEPIKFEINQIKKKIADRLKNINKILHTNSVVH